MSIRDEENKLFGKWEGDRPNRKPFVKDGIANESAYKKDRVKTAFVLKEYANDVHDHDLREAELKFYRYKIWINVAKALHGVRVLSGDAHGHVDGKMPESICAFNLDKSGGPNNTDMARLALIAMDDREFIKEQLDIYNPHLIICCGTFDIFRYITGHGYENPNETKEHRFRWYKSSSGNYVVDAYHPSYSRWNDTYTYQLIGAIQEIGKGTELKIQ